MPRYHIFHDGKLLDAVDILPSSELKSIPLGAYILSYKGTWFVIKADRGGTHIDKIVPLPLVPPEVRALALLFI